MKIRNMLGWQKVNIYVSEEAWKRIEEENKRKEEKKNNKKQDKKESKQEKNFPKTMLVLGALQFLIVVIQLLIQVQIIPIP